MNQAPIPTTLHPIGVRVKEPDPKRPSVPAAISEIVREINNQRVDFEGEGMTQDQFVNFARESFEAELTDLSTKLEFYPEPIPPTSSMCQCKYHKYPVVHIERGQIWSDAQAQVLAASGLINNIDAVETYDSKFYLHGMTPHMLRFMAISTEAVENEFLDRSRFVQDLTTAIQERTVERDQNLLTLLRRIRSEVAIAKTSADITIEQSDVESPSVIDMCIPGIIENIDNVLCEVEPAIEVLEATLTAHELLKGCPIGCAIAEVTIDGKNAECPKGDYIEGDFNTVPGVFKKVIDRKGGTEDENKVN